VTEMRCVQLAAIERTAAGAALVAGVKAKNLDASAVDLLRIVKVRCRRRALWPVRGCPSGPPEYAGTLEHPRVSLSMVGTPQQRRRATSYVCRRVPLHRGVLLRAQHAAAAATVEYPKSTVEYPRARLSTQHA
jgi:hypothetical protein